jgi:hypothetical protein
LMIEILQLRRRTGKSANEFAFDAAQIAPTSSAEINFDLASTIFAKNRPAPLVRSSGARSRGVRLLVRLKPGATCDPGCRPRGSLFGKSVT